MVLLLLHLQVIAMMTISFTLYELLIEPWVDFFTTVSELCNLLFYFSSYVSPDLHELILVDYSSVPVFPTLSSGASFIVAWNAYDSRVTFKCAENMMGSLFFYDVSWGETLFIQCCASNSQYSLCLLNLSKFPLSLGGLWLMPSRGTLLASSSATRAIANSVPHTLGLSARMIIKRQKLFGGLGLRGYFGEKGLARGTSCLATIT